MSEVNEIEKNIEVLKNKIAMRDQVLKLERNRDFRAIILDGFCTNEAAKYVQTAGDPNLSQESRDDALALALASGHVLRFLAAIKNQGNAAESSLPRAEAALIEARVEEGMED